MRPVDHSDDTLFALGQAEDFGRFTTATPVGRQSAPATDDEAQRATEPQAESRQCRCEAPAKVPGTRRRRCSSRNAALQPGASSPASE